MQRRYCHTRRWRVAFSAASPSRACAKTKRRLERQSGSTDLLYRRLSPVSGQRVLRGVSRPWNQTNRLRPEMPRPVAKRRVQTLESNCSFSVIGDFVVELLKEPCRRSNAAAGLFRWRRRVKMRLRQFWTPKFESMNLSAPTTNFRKNSWRSSFGIRFPIVYSVLVSMGRIVVE